MYQRNFYIKATLYQRHWNCKICTRSPRCVRSWRCRSRSRSLHALVVAYSESQQVTSYICCRSCWSWGLFIACDWFHYTVQQGVCHTSRYIYLQGTRVESRKCILRSQNWVFLAFYYVSACIAHCFGCGHEKQTFTLLGIFNCEPKQRSVDTAGTRHYFIRLILNCIAQWHDQTLDLFTPLKLLRDSFR